MTVECQACTEAVNQNYTLNTGILTVCPEGGGGDVLNLGNVKGLSFRHTPEFIDHFRGRDGALDAVIPLRKNFGMDMVLEELTPANFALMVGGTQIANTPSGCLIPFTGISGDCSLSTGSVEFFHQFACGAKTLTITFWRAVIASAESVLTFGPEILEIPITVRALPCDSQYPDKPFGQAVFSDECATS